MPHNRARVLLRKNLRRSIERGHPWIFDKAVDAERGFRAGQLVRLADEHGDIATCVVDPDSPIRLRVIDLNAGAVIDAKWLRKRSRAAALRRKRDRQLSQATALRLVHGEADGLPGLVVDSYAGEGIALLDGAAAEALYLPMLDELKSGLESGGAKLHKISARRVGRQREWLTRAPPKAVRIREGQATMEVDLRQGQKTGLFLDQRENRRLVGERSRGRSVLNLFCYTGGFSLAAALGGAKHTTSVDIAAPAIDAAKRNFELSGLSAQDHEFVASDVFDFLEHAVAEEQRFDLVICDPPSFASSEKALKKGLHAYRKVNAQALRVVGPGGLFCSASCSSHVSEEHLLEVLADAALESGRTLVVTEIRGAASDHPVRAGFPEGRYLNFLVCRVD